MKFIIVNLKSEMSCALSYESWNVLAYNSNKYDLEQGYKATEERARICNATLTVGKIDEK